MKIYSISILKKEAAGSTQLCIEQDVSSFSFFQRGTVGQFLTFFSKTLSERTATGTRQTVQEQEYMCHAFSSANGLSGICIADAEYPARVAFGLLSKITDEFAQEYPTTKWTGADGATPYPALKGLLAKYQNPQEADALSRIHKELDETKVILHKNMEDLLDRGEKLDDLVSKSEGLSSSAKMFYKQAKKTNSCCQCMQSEELRKRLSNRASSDMETIGKVGMMNCANELSLGIQFSHCRDIRELVSTTKQNQYSFTVVPLVHPRYRRKVVPVDPTHQQLPFTRSDQLMPCTEWSTYVVGGISEWINCDSCDPSFAKNSMDALRQEVAWASHLSLAAILLPAPRKHHMNYFREIARIVLKQPYMNIWFRVAYDDVHEDPWETWVELRTLCDNHARLHVVLDLPANSPPSQELRRWLGENVKAVNISEEIFLTNAQGYPVLSKRYQKYLNLLLQRKVQFVLQCTTSSLESLLPYQQYLRWLCRLQPQTQQEEFEAPYADYLQMPLQPLADNLESATYETFEKDPVKYAQYEAAVELALRERHSETKTATMMVVGAGRGPLVAASLRAADTVGVKVKLYAVEKNPNAVVTLQHRRIREKWGDRVEIISCDMRKWDAPHKADIMVSELLGSFGDNELSPECLDGAQRLLAENGVSIPQNYTSFMAPLTSSKLWGDVRNFRDVEHFETSYVVKVHTACQLAEAKPVFYFEHPNVGYQSNERECELSWTLDHSATVHGFVGYFESQLYGDIYISINPATFSTGMFSWFPIYFPIKEPMFVKAGEEINAQMWRCCTPEKVWYEWALTSPGVTNIHNPNGRSSNIGL